MPTTLAELEVLLADGQSTGASPAHGHLLELGWARVRAQDEPGRLQVDARLLALPDGATIPAPVTRLTGIGPEQMARAEPPARVWAALCLAAAQRPVVIHYARFELAFLRALHQHHAPERPFPLRVVCTHEIARRLLPSLPRRGLRALAGYFGLGVDALKRSAEHVQATALVWRHLVDLLRAEHAIDTLAGLDTWLAVPPPRPAAKRAYPMDRDKRLGLPDAPGVYRMTRQNGEILYVGKATSLRKRVNGYFRQHRRVAERTLQMLTQARDLDVTVTDTVLEAALLENDEIKAHDPPYNVMLKGDRRCVWYASSDLRRWSETRDRGHRRGPLGSRRLLDAWPSLLEQWGQAPGQPVHLAWWDVEIEPAVWREGTERFGTRWLGGARPSKHTTLVGAGTRIWERWRDDVAKSRAAGKLDPDPAPEPPDPERPWDPERVADALERMVGQGAHELRRAQWLGCLAHATIGWQRPDPAWRLLMLDGGAVVHREHRPRLGALPCPPARAASVFDVVTFDRLRVLTAELRRIVGDGREVRLRLGPRRWLAGERLRRTLRMV